MERGGVQPDFLVEPTPEQLAKGDDPQVEKAVDVLRGDVLVWKQQRHGLTVPVEGAAPITAGTKPPAAPAPGGSN
jgi:hypothetical protein